MPFIFRPVVARAVLKTYFLSIDSFNKLSFVKIYSKHRPSQVLKVTDLKLLDKIYHHLGVTCHRSHVMWNVSRVRFMCIFFLV